MGINETLDRLAKERELKKEADAYVQEITQASDRFCNECDKMREEMIINGIAERIFFQSMLKDINSGLSEPKIAAMIDRSVMIATRLYNKLYQ